LVAKVVLQDVGVAAIFAPPRLFSAPCVSPIGGDAAMWVCDPAKSGCRRIASRKLGGDSAATSLLF